MRADPRVVTTPEQWREMTAFLDDIRETVDAIHRAVIRMRKVRDQVNALVELTSDHAEADTLAALGDTVKTAITAWEETLVQPKQQTFQDVINFPNRLNAQFLNLMNLIDGSGPPVTQGARARFVDLMAEWTERQAEMRRILAEDVAAFNAMFESLGIPAVIVPEITDGEASSSDG